MEVDNSEWNIIQEALRVWEQEGKISAGQKETLLESVHLKKPEHQVAQYFFIIAISCTLLAFAAIFIDDRLLETIKSYFSLSNWVIAAVTGLLSAAWFYYLRQKKRRFSAVSFECFMVLGGLTALTALVYACKDFEQRLHYSTLLLLATLLLAGLGAGFRSVALWTAALVGLCGWYGAFTSWQSYGNLFLGMNYPVRFAVLGLLILGGAQLQRKVPRLSAFRRITYVFGLLTLFTALWGMSVFGNYGSYAQWTAVRQTQVLLYAVLFAAAAGLAFYLGIRNRDSLTRDVGILFLLINLYTRYFEYFWDNINKGIFFLLLAVSFWLLGRWIEKRKRRA